MLREYMEANDLPFINLINIRNFDGDWEHIPMQFWKILIDILSHDELKDVIEGITVNGVQIRGSDTVEIQWRELNYNHDASNGKNEAFLKAMNGKIGIPQRVPLNTLLNSWVSYFSEGAELPIESEIICIGRTPENTHTDTGNTIDTI